MSSTFIEWWPVAAVFASGIAMLAVGAGRWWGWAIALIATGGLWTLYALLSGHHGTLGTTLFLAVVYALNAGRWRRRPMGRRPFVVGSPQPAPHRRAGDPRP